MFVKITSSGGRQYIKLVEAFRDDTGVPRQRGYASRTAIVLICLNEPSRSHAEFNATKSPSISVNLLQALRS
jgi:hypothetical protein